MTVRQTLHLAAMVGCLVAMPLATVPAQAQAAADAQQCTRTRAEVRDECIAFLKLHDWDEASSNWVLKGSAPVPEGVATRAQIRAERDKYLSTNRWNGALSRWEPISGPPRNVSKRSRAEVRDETRAFMRTHVWDEGSGTYIERKAK